MGNLIIGFAIIILIIAVWAVYIDYLLPKSTSKYPKLMYIAAILVSISLYNATGPKHFFTFLIGVILLTSVLILFVVGSAELKYRADKSDSPKKSYALLLIAAIILIAGLIGYAFALLYFLDHILIDWK